MALSFDDAAMEVLDWLEGCSFEWDMYVDLPANCVRYCFRTVTDAWAFKQRFAHAQEGRVLSPAGINRGWPYQVASPARFCEGGGYDDIREFCVNLKLCPRGHPVFDGEWFHVYCFAKSGDAEKFRERFDSVKFDPGQRGRGSNWARWSRRKATL